MRIPNLRSAKSTNPCSARVSRSSEKRSAAKLWLRSVGLADNPFSTDASPFGWRSWPRSAWSVRDELGNRGEAGRRRWRGPPRHCDARLGKRRCPGGFRAKRWIDFVGLREGTRGGRGLVTTGGSEHHLPEREDGSDAGLCWREWRSSVHTLAS